MIIFLNRGSWEISCWGASTCLYTEVFVWCVCCPCKDVHSPSDLAGFRLLVGYYSDNITLKVEKGDHPPNCPVNLLTLPQPDYTEWVEALGGWRGSYTVTFGLFYYYHTFISYISAISSKTIQQQVRKWEAAVLFDSDAFLYLIICI